MSHPVSVLCNVVNPGLFKSVAESMACKVEESLNKEGQIIELKVNSSNFYRPLSIKYDVDSNSYKAVGDDMDVKKYSKLFTMYNAHQIKESCEQSGKFEFGQNWMTQDSNGDILVNARYNS